jgi:hypothetical protein
MKIKYSFEKLLPIASVLDGYSANASVSTPYSILETLFNYRQADATSWEEIIADIELVLQTPENQNIYNENGFRYEGKYNIEQNEVLKQVQVGWGSYNVIQPVEIISQNRLTTIKDFKTQQIFHFKTIEILAFVKQWYQFLKSDQIKLNACITIEMIEL